MANSRKPIKWAPGNTWQQTQYKDGYADYLRSQGISPNRVAVDAFNYWVGDANPAVRSAFNYATNTLEPTRQSALTQLVSALTPGGVASQTARMQNQARAQAQSQARQAGMNQQLNPTVRQALQALLTSQGTQAANTALLGENERVRQALQQMLGIATEGQNSPLMASLLPIMGILEQARQNHINRQSGGGIGEILGGLGQIAGSYNLFKNAGQKSG